MSDNEKLIHSLDEKAGKFKIVERRKRKDNLLQIINFACFYVWALFFLALCIVEKAGNRSIGYIFKEQIKIKDGFDTQMLYIALRFSVILFFVCVVCFFVSLKRTRRRTDKIKISFFICELVTFLLGIFLLYKIY